jgi:hypothetical protein
MATTAEVNAFNKKVADDMANSALTVGTFNINQYVNQNPAPVQEAMHIAMRTGASVIGVQEYCEFWNLPTSTSKIPGVYDYVATGKVSDLSWGSGWAGNAIISKHPLSVNKSGIFKTELPQPEDISLPENKNVCGYVKSQFTKFGKVSFYNVHFFASWNVSGVKDAEIVESQARELAEIIKADGTYYKVITGDFNIKDVKYLKPLTDLGFQPVFPFGEGQIDNILVLGHMPVINKGKVKVPDSVSDHDFCYATFKFH